MKLSGRERLVLIVGGVATALVLFFQFGLSPARARLKTLDRLVVQQERDVQEMKAVRETYLARKAVMEELNNSLSRRGKDFAILSFLEDLAIKAGVKSNIIYMKPALSTAGELYRESSVEMKLEGITLQQLLQYLYQIEHAPQLLRVRRLHIRPRFANPDILDITFQVSTFYPLDKTG